MMDEPECAAWTARVLASLSHEKRRCTYKALTGLLGVPAQSVAQRYLGTPRQAASWVVSTTTGRPTNCTTAQCHPDLPPDPITDPDELRRCVAAFDARGDRSREGTTPDAAPRTGMPSTPWLPPVPDRWGCA